MRILLLTQYFPPETGAAQNRLSDLAHRLVSAGHKVSVLTSMPNYPQGRVFEGYRGRMFLSETKGGSRILRGWCYVTQNRGFISRLLNYCSFAICAFFVGVLAAGKQDLIVVESPPLFLGITGVALSRWRGAAMILNVSDLWPESAVSMGILRSRSLIKLASALERCIYRCSYAITGQTEGIVEYIRSCASGMPVELVTNGVDPQLFSDAARERSDIRAEFGFENKFIVGYTGLHGLAQHLETLLEAAETLATANQGILFAFFGDGPDKHRLEKVAADKQLTNVVFFSPQARERMPGILASLDAAVVPLKNVPLFSGALPSKLFECMAAGLPIVLSAPRGEASALVECANAGICVPPENSTGLAEAIKSLALDPAFSRILGDNGRRYVCCHYDRQEIARRFMNLLPRISSTEATNSIPASRNTAIE